MLNKPENKTEEVNKQNFTVAVFETNDGIVIAGLDELRQSIDKLTAVLLLSVQKPIVTSGKQ